MIKRLKWNVLYGSDDSGPDGDSSGDSDDEYEKAAEALAELTRNDPNLNPPTDENDDDGDDFVRDEFSEEDNTAKENEEQEERQPQESETPEFIEWRECDICPGKRFLNDAEVESHLASKAHQRALKRYERAMNEKSQLTNDVDESEPTLSKTERRKQHRRKRLQELSSGGSSDAKMNSNDIIVEKETMNGDETKQEEMNGIITENAPNGEISDPAAAERKKKALKRKLKKMKERKWKAAQERKATENGASPSEKTISKEPLRNNVSVANGKEKTSDFKPKVAVRSSIKRPGNGMPGGKKKRKKRGLALQ